MMAFDCPLVCPEILEGLQGVSEEQHSAASCDVGGLTVLAKLTKTFREGTFIRLFSLMCYLIC